MKKISVVFTAFNEANFIRSSLQDIHHNTVTPHEIIVVDDVSTDNTRKELNGLDYVKIVENTERLGVARARREGVERANNELICFMDAHCWTQGNRCLDILAEELDKPSRARTIMVPSFTIVSSKSYKEKGLTGKVNYGSGLSFDTSRFWFYLSVTRRWVAKISRRLAFHAPGIMMRRECYDEMGGWPNLPGWWSGNDHAFSLRAFLMDIPVLAHSDAHIFHYAKSHTQRQVPRLHEVINRVCGARLTFSDALFKNFWLPHFQERYASRFEAGELDEVLEDEWIAEEHKEVSDKYRVNEMKALEEFVYPQMKKKGLLVA